MPKHGPDGEWCTPGGRDRTISMVQSGVPCAQRLDLIPGLTIGGCQQLKVAGERINEQESSTTTA